jgi:CheY-like chemotaxis protein
VFAVICVLIVDDQPDVRLSFGFMLTALEYKVAEAATGKDAVEYLKKNHIDVVLTDIYMPDMNGVELIERIREMPKPPKIIAMTGSDNLGYGASLQAAAIVGADAVLKKPITRVRLQTTIYGLMHDRREKPRH